ncbi:MAG: MBL fold metallo-hydrolase [Gammaproteobacteria bacterium]|nr:MBL fold metallo-hydrolase [Gammaproteobacteria bacterium]MDH5304302.1 MBL fold metallo-hydrolase [Gammaproteobacteria bacterium]MDH5322593.1 MBL fold metallo-hydrolase [Gammaproteobacteria bacterium]MDH5501519.1 MBL fold metallo-hydrolase [Gammaproteobacteria bacterium]
MPGPYPQTTRLQHGLVAIDTEYARPMQDASHLIVEGGRGAFVDTGVNSSVPLLLAALAGEDLDAGDVDYVFLTHIHLDHAGGAGLLMQQLPNARCVVHPRGAPHMVDPAKIIAGTEAVYGKQNTAMIYGRIVPIAAERIDIADDGQVFSLRGRELEVFYTEGHARHHYCLSDPSSQGIFTGDSFGVSYRELDTTAGEFIFPTTTPVHFDPVEAHKSIDRIMSYAPERLYLTHYSEVGNLERLAADLHAGIDMLVAIAEQNADAVERTTAIQNAIFEFFVSALTRHGFKGDRDTIWSILSMDVTLNTQGIEVWLDKTRKGSEPF